MLLRTPEHLLQLYGLLDLASLSELLAVFVRGDPAQLEGDVEAVRLLLGPLGQVGGVVRLAVHLEAGVTEVAHAHSVSIHDTDHGGRAPDCSYLRKGALKDVQGVDVALGGGLLRAAVVEGCRLGVGVVQSLQVDEASFLFLKFPFLVLFLILLLVTGFQFRAARIHQLVGEGVAAEAEVVPATNPVSDAEASFGDEEGVFAVVGDLAY